MNKLISVLLAVVLLAGQGNAQGYNYINKEKSNTQHYYEKDKQKEAKKAEDKNNMKLSFSLGDLNYGAAKTGEMSYEYFSVSVFHLYFEENRSNLTVRFSPYTYYSIDKEEKYDPDNKSAKKESFLNFDLSFNPFGNRSVIFFGPFASVNYLVLNNGAFDYKDFIFNSGIRISLREKPAERSKFGYFANAVSVEGGYRYIDNEHGYYININTDLLVVFYVLLMASKN